MKLETREPADPFESAIGNDARAGQRQSIRPGEVATVVNLVGDDLCSRPFTLSLGWTIDAAPDLGVVEVQARIQWGSGGAMLAAIVDVPAEGVVVQVCGATVRAEMAVSVVGGEGAAEARVNCAGMVATGPRPTIPPGPVRTIAYPGIAGGGGIATLAIPVFAASVDIFAVPNPATAPAVITAAFLDRAGGVVYEAPTVQRNLPVPRGAASLRLTNGGVGALTSARAVYAIRL